MSSRSVWKGPFVQPKLLKKIEFCLSNNITQPIRTWSRNSTILPNFVGLSFLVHNGKIFHRILINEKMVGKKLGEFSDRKSVV